MKEIQIKVSPCTPSSLDRFNIHYRPVKKFNLFNIWVPLDISRNGRWRNAILKEAEALELAKKFKDNPELIDVWEATQFEEHNNFQNRKKIHTTII